MIDISIDLKILEINEEQLSYPKEVKKIKEFLKEEGITATNGEIECIWVRVSAERDAQWLGLGTKEEVLEMIGEVCELE
jgi:hypothetical protein